MSSDRKLKWLKSILLVKVFFCFFVWGLPYLHRPHGLLSASWRARCPMIPSSSGYQEPLSLHSGLPIGTRIRIQSAMMLS